MAGWVQRRTDPYTGLTLWLPVVYGGLGSEADWPINWSDFVIAGCLWRAGIRGGLTHKLVWLWDIGLFTMSWDQRRTDPYTGPTFRYRVVYGGLGSEAGWPVHWSDFEISGCFRRAGNSGGLTHTLVWLWDIGLLNGGLGPMLVWPIQWRDYELSGYLRMDWDQWWTDPYNNLTLS